MRELNPLHKQALEAGIARVKERLGQHGYVKSVIQDSCGDYVATVAVPLMRGMWPILVLQGFYVKESKLTLEEVRAEVILRTTPATGWAVQP